jgi:transcriptional regulator with XRE-family HTH domain
MRSDTTFGQRLRHSRQEAGLSQSALESRSGIPKARLSRYENGHVLPSIGTLGKLAKALGVSEANLLGDQRTIVEEFFDVLLARGVVIQSPEQARKLAGAVADIYEALGLTVTESDSPAVARATMADVVDPPMPFVPPA